MFLFLYFCLVDGVAVGDGRLAGRRFEHASARGETLWASVRVRRIVDGGRLPALVARLRSSIQRQGGGDSLRDDQVEFQVFEDARRSERESLLRSGGDGDQATARASVRFR